MSKYQPKHSKNRGTVVIKKNIGVILLAVFVAIAALVYFAVGGNSRDELTTTTTTIEQPTVTDPETTTSFIEEPTTTEAPTTTTVPETTTSLAETTTTESQSVAGQFNVIDYGAIGDGTGDNRIAFQAAVDAAFAAGGGTVYVPTGVYNFSTYTVVGNYVVAIQLRNNVYLAGASMDSTFLISEDASAIIVGAFDARNIGLSNLDLTTKSPIGIIFVGSNGLQLKQLDVHTTMTLG